jgi:hypothetical protein
MPLSLSLSLSLFLSLSVTESMAGHVSFILLSEFFDTFSMEAQPEEAIPQLLHVTPARVLVKKKSYLNSN